jgi:hypothetical protein
MAAEKKSRPILNGLFSNGERPTGEDFASAWLSFLNQKEDGISYDGKNIVLTANTGITLGNPAGGPGGAAGTLRFNGTRVQYYDPGANDFKDIAGSAGAFLPIGAGPAVSYGLGNVGIGNYVSPTVPTHRLEVQLNDNSGPAQQVLFGNLVIHNGLLAKPGAYIGNNALAGNATGYALSQDSIGRTRINAPNVNNSGVSLAINEVDKLVITKDGDISISPTTSLGISGVVSIGSFVKGSVLGITNRTDLASGVPGIAALTLTGDATGNPGALPTLVVNGIAQKTNGGVWGATSDKRVKKEIRPFDGGLQKLLLFDPVVYKFNGKGGTIDNGKDYIGLIAQDVEKVMPELIISQHIKLNAEDAEESDVLGHDLSPLTFMFINAVKELNDRLGKLEKSKKNEKRKASNTPGADN